MNPKKTMTTLVTATAVFALAGGATAGDAKGRDVPLPFVAAADANGDGNVSEAEFSSHLKAQFASLDTDRNGFLTKSELPKKLAMVDDDEADPDDFIDENDANDDKQVTEVEYTQTAMKEFRDADENSDRMLTPKEREEADSILAKLTPGR